MFEKLANYTNLTARDQIAWMEPWCEEIIIRPGKAFTFRGFGAEDGEIEIDERNEGIIVYGWPTSKIKVESDGDIIWEADFEVPPMPPGMTMRGFAKFLFHQDPPGFKQNN